MKVYRTDNKDTRTFLCPYCKSSNPISVYCCLHCFKVISRTKNFSAAKFYVPPVISFAILSLVFIFLGANVFSRWMEGFEANMALNDNLVRQEQLINMQKMKVKKFADMLRFPKVKLKPTTQAVRLPQEENPSDVEK